MRARVKLTLVVRREINVSARRDRHLAVGQVRIELGLADIDRLHGVAEVLEQRIETDGLEPCQGSFGKIAVSVEGGAMRLRSIGDEPAVGELQQDGRALQIVP
ncbi:hypothetical protein QET40_00265 [Akkermansia sp. N21169]|uniref:hypothetical protein n=1 Tax=Akkermansia sp. N21169 TaxID=3040765 RepID=UPI00244EE321|nr:hypothetical protein [Akkermansia sp. N21169]MDH3067537.1 hypothetical protein [Akkermansia sp. N21169]